MAGYSGTPLAAKLGIKAGTALLPVHPPQGYLDLLAPLPAGVVLQSRLAPRTDIVHVFSTSRRRLEALLRRTRKRMRDDAAVWVSWPKKTASQPTDLSEDVVRALALPLGLVDVKVCAVDATWSALKLVVRREQRRVAHPRS